MHQGLLMGDYRAWQPMLDTSLQPMAVPDHWLLQESCPIY
jgi:hypothetical protein